MQNMTCDLLVVGSGAAGLSAAITARFHGLDVMVVDKEPWLGGTTAVSGGWLWIPCNPVAKRAGADDTVQAARTYLQHEAGARFDAERVDSFLENGPRMVEFFERETAVKFAAAPSFPDYHFGAPGSAMGRAIVTEPFDARELADNLHKLRPPLRETTFFGLNVGSGSEVNHFFNARRSLISAAYVANRIARHILDTIFHGRGMRLANGNALTGRLAKTAFDLGVKVLLSTSALKLLIENGTVVGAVLQSEKEEVRVAARRGVVLACGGFSHDVARRASLFAHTPTGTGHHSPSVSGASGDGLRLGEAAGGVVERDLRNAAAWMPVSLVSYSDGSTGVFPHVIDRAKPGVVAVLGSGQRFVNEAVSYHDFVQAMIAANEGETDTYAFVICDHRAIRRYGLGHVKPFPFPLGAALKSGYLIQGRTLHELAQHAGINAQGLEKTIAEFNADAREGRDLRFGKGSTAYNRFQGDPLHQPNPCVAPLLQPPFYAVKILPGDIGTFAGLKTDRLGRALNDRGVPIDGLYAAGSDMASIMGGNYPGAGINLGPAMTFGYIIGCHTAGVAT
jgi:succinate dehydrogenase/fumarate reductase flavoprotein subunit